VLAHVAYGRQLQLKGEILRDALGRIGKVPLASSPDLIGSPQQGYRMRARLHAGSGRLGFYREGTHDLCAPGPTGQLLPETVAWIESAEAVLQRGRLDGVLALEIAENVPGTERATHVELREGVDPRPYAPLTSAANRITDVLHPREGDSSTALRLRRDVRAFFQGNRYLLERLVQHVLGLVPPGPVVDLYAGVGLFGLSLAAAGAEHVTLVEGDPVSGADLVGNAEPFGDRVRVERRSVEAYLAGPAGPLAPNHDARGTRPPYRSVERAMDPATTFIIDPPRTGLSRDALREIIRARPARLVYVSCDVATLARDTRALLDADYSLDQLTGIDLFPKTAHVESVAAFNASPL
jgi:23S rRNA (uracil1939-C5)-methyltransferase